MYKISLTLCDKVVPSNIPVLEYDNADESCEMVEVWLESKLFALCESPSVFVSFETERCWDENFCRMESALTFTVTGSVDIIMDHAITCLTQHEGVDDDAVSDIDFAIFEFESYEEAFGYCSDLKEGS